MSTHYPNPNPNPYQYQTYQTSSDPKYQYVQQPLYYQQQPTATWTQGWLSFNDPGYIKGLVVGAAAAYIVSNPTVQRAVVKGAVSLWAAVQGGVEEIKEQIQDIKSELSVRAEEKAD